MFFVYNPAMVIVFEYAVVVPGKWVSTDTAFIVVLSRLALGSCSEFLLIIGSALNT